jgi:hypothetical protein
MAIAGVANGALFWLAVGFADQTRRSNIMLRAPEIPLNRVDDHRLKPVESGCGLKAA